MAKKLKVELEVDNTEAKRKAKEVAATAATPAPFVQAERPKSAKVPFEQPAPQPAPPTTPTPPSTPSADPSGTNAHAARAAKDAADGLDKAGRSARNLSNGAEESSRSLKDVARGFAGLGVGMSLKFARQFVEQGSAEDRALGIGESAANLGFMGAKMGGPWGAVIGTVVGAGKGWMESD